MPWRESLEPVRMRRVALLAPRDRLRDVLVAVAASGLVEVDSVQGGGAGPAALRLQRMAAAGAVEPVISVAEPDLDALEAAGRADLLAGEAEVAERAAAALPRDLVVAVGGWMPEAAVGELAEQVAPMGGAVVGLPTPRGVDPPTLLHTRGGLNRSFAPLVDTYASVPYVDVDPTAIAGLAFVFMFGMMFADAGQGLLLVVLGLLLRAGRPSRLARFRAAWPFLLGAGISATVFGVLFGEFFGPTEVLPVLWVRPLEEPILLLAVAIGIGACLLSGAYVLGTVNRWREGGWRLALVSPTGIAGIAVFLGMGLASLGAYLAQGWLVIAGIVVVVGGLGLTFIGLLAAAGGGGAGAAQAGVELFDGVIRLGTNLVSFARLAAFGLAHAALGGIVLSGASALWGAGGVLPLAGVVVFVLGNVVTFALQAIVAGVQALRLEYYELFSKVFVSEGRPFQPWSVPTTRERVQ
jgi:V/A-type H+-transporting ATPase subunit I